MLDAVFHFESLTCRRRLEKDGMILMILSRLSNILLMPMKLTVGCVRKSPLLAIQTVARMKTPLRFFFQYILKIICSVCI
jgi:hypothetical protein